MTTYRSADNPSVSRCNYATYFYLLHEMSNFYDRQVGVSPICFPYEYRRRLRYGFSSPRHNLTTTSYPCKHLCLFDNRGLHGNTSLFAPNVSFQQYPDGGFAFKLLFAPVSKYYEPFSGISRKDHVSISPKWQRLTALDVSLHDSGRIVDESAKIKFFSCLFLFNHVIL